MATIDSIHFDISKAFAAGQKILDATGKFSALGSDALKKVTEEQLGLSAALVELGGAQFKNLGLVADPKAFLQSQKDGAEAFRAKLGESLQSLKGMADETQKAYADLAKEVAADLGLPGA